MGVTAHSTSGRGVRWSKFGGSTMSLLTLVIVAIILAPIVTVVVSSFWSAPFLQLPGRYTFGNFAKILSSRRNYDLLTNTAIYTFFGSLLAVFLGAVLAWIVTRVRMPLSRLAVALPVMPLFVPALLKDTSWVELFSPTTGLVNLGVNHLFGLQTSLFNIYSMTGMIVTAGIGLAPVAYLMLVGPLGAIDRSLEEASLASGAGLLRTIVRVTIPAVMPAVISSFALISIMVASSFETPIIIGLPGGISTFMSAIFRTIAGGGAPNFSMASAQSVIYLVLIGLLLAWYLWATRREGKFALVAPRGASEARIDLGVWRYALFAFVLVYWIVSFAALVGIAVLISLIPYYTVTGGNPFRNFNLGNYYAVFADGAGESMWSSVLLALIVSACTVACAVLLAMVSLRSRWKFRRLADVAGTLPIAIPPLVFSVALLVTVLSVPGFNRIYNSWTPMIIASVAAFLPFALRAVSSGLIAIPRSMEEASASSGASNTRTLFSITLPIMSSALIGAALLVFVYSLRELAAVALLIRPGTKLLPTQVFGYLQVGKFNLASTLNVISIVLTAGAFGFLLLLRKLIQVAARSMRLQSMDAASSPSLFVSRAAKLRRVS